MAGHDNRQITRDSLFLLANEMPDTLGRRYRWWSWVHLIAFFATGIAALLLLGFK